MDSHPANSFFTNLFNRTEKPEDTPVLSSFRSLSEKTTDLHNISIQKAHNIRFDNDSPAEKDLKAIDVSNQINGTSTSETEVLTQTEVVLAKTNPPRDECNNHNTLGQKSSLEQMKGDANAETYINTNMEPDEVNIQEVPTHTGKEFLDKDLQISMDQSNSGKDSYLTYQGDRRVADGQAALLSKAVSQKYNDACLSNTAPAQNHRSGSLSECISKQPAEILLDKTKEPSHMDKNEEQYTENTFQTSSVDINNPISTIAVSGQVDEATSTFKSKVGIPNGDFDTNTMRTHSVTGNNKSQPKEESWSSLSPDTCNGCHAESDRQFSAETGDAFLKVKSDQGLLKLEATTPDRLGETQKWSGTNNVQELSMLEMKTNGGQHREAMMKSESDNLGQVEEENKERVMKEEEKDMLKEDSNSESLGIPSAPGNLEEPPNTENASRPTRRVTFSPGLKLEKPPQLPNIFSGLKGLKKEVHDHQKKAPSLEQPKSPVLMKQTSVKRALFTEKRSRSEVKGSILEQLSQLLSFDAGKVGAKKPQEPTESPSLSPSSEAPIAELPPIEESVEGHDVPSSEESGKLTNTETALNAFKAFFTPKPVKRDISDNIDLDAVKRAFNPETIRAIFDRNSSKSPDNRDILNTKVCTENYFSIVH